MSQGFSLEPKSVIEQFNYVSNIKDYVQNVLLFIPLGVGLAMLNQNRLNYSKILILSLAVGSIVSTTVELTQLWLPSRVSNLSDIVCNSVGACWGATIYYCRVSLFKFCLGIVTLDRQKLSLASLSTAIAGYCSLVFVALCILSLNSNLSNWDDDYYLALGNEVTGDRPWSGYISQVYLSDRALNQSEVAAIFSPQNVLPKYPNLLFSIEAFQKPNHQKLTQLTRNRLSLLQTNQKDTHNSKPKANLKVNERGIYVNEERWLKSNYPAKLINQKIRESNEFSLFLKFAAAKINQAGPARIFTLSNSIYAHNLLVGQEGQDLILRLRTPITGDAPTQPELVIPRIFNSNEERVILITFAQKKLTFYLKYPQQKYSYKFNYANSFISYLPFEIANYRVDLTASNTLKYQLVFYSTISIPLIVLVLVLAYYLWFSYLTY